MYPFIHLFGKTIASYYVCAALAGIVGFLLAAHMLGRLNKKENKDLYGMLEKNEQDIQKLKAQLEQKVHEYNALKTARMIEVTDGDLQGSKTRLAKLIRDVDKCIAILSDEK